MHLHIFFPEGDHDSGVDESTQRGSPRKGAATNGSRLPKKTPPQSPTKAGGARSRPGGRGHAATAASKARSQSVPKPFSTFGATPPSQDRKGTVV